MSELKEQIRNSNPVAEVISEKVVLRPVGNHLVGLCPFHSDQHKPNLNVFPETESFFCFACGAGGDVFSFVMRDRSLPFIEALRLLAERKNIPFHPQGYDPAKEEKSRAVETALREAAVLYHNALPPTVREYLQGRTLTDETIDQYLIGFCDGKTVLQASKETLIEAGLIYESGGHYFEGFITFPHRQAGRVVYMSGRGWPEKSHKKLPKEKVPLLYLYNEDALRKPHVVIAEGEIDTLTLLQRGFNACGVLGANSFKDEWAGKFGNCEKVYLSFDGDEAGRGGNQKIAALLGLNARLVSMPDGEDINDFFKHKTASDYQQLLDESLDLFQTRIDAIPSNTSRMELPRLLKPILEEIAGLEDTAYADALLQHYIKPHFDLKAKELQSYEAVLKQCRKAKGKAEPAASSESLTQEQLIEILKTEESGRMVNPSQDFRGGVMNFTVMIQQMPYLLTSRRELISFEQAPANGIILQNQEVSTARFSAKGIAEFMEGGREVNIPRLYERIHAYIKRFIFFADTRVIAYLSLWVMGTHLFSIFRYYPYIWLNAEKGSGKTLLMEVLAAIAFNGELVTNPTEATLFRDVAYNMTTLFIDEVENLRKQDKEVVGAIMAVLNTGFCKSGSVKRMEKTPEGNYALKAFPTYSPKVFAGINEISDILQDRTVRIRLLKKKDNEVAERYKETEEVLRLQEAIRDDLYCFALLYGDQIALLYHGEGGTIEGTGHLFGRELDIWEPIILLANVIDGLSENAGVTESMKALSAESLKEKQADSVAQNNTYQLYTVMKAMLEELAPMETDGTTLVFDSETVLEYFKKTDEFEWLEKKNSLTLRLKRIGVQSEQKRDGAGKVRVYIVDRKKFEDLCERFKI